MRRSNRFVLGFLFAALPLASSVGAPETFKIDPNHSQVGFTIRHLLSHVPGHFNTFSGEIAVDTENLAASKVSADIDVASIDTSNANRDKHLKSPDFFNVEKFPKMTFVSTGVASSSKDHATLTGNLTMAGVTKPVTLDVSILGFLDTPRGKWAGFEAKTKLNRKEFGIVWNKDLDKGSTLLGEDVEITLLVEANSPKPEEAKPAADAKPGSEAKPAGAEKPGSATKPGGGS